MLRKSVLPVVIALLVIAPFPLAPHTLNGQTSDAVALSGTVRSQEEGQMEGVVVSARRDGANFTVSVVSDAQGRYSFPRTHVEPGSYDMTARAVGYDLRSPGPVDVAADAPANADLQLRVTTDPASQLSSLEWAMSMPGTAEEKDKLVYQALSCAYCHTYERIVKSRHTAEEFVDVITRMQTYYPDGTAASESGRGRAQPADDARLKAIAQDPSPTWGNVLKTDLARYLATVNLSGGKTTWPYELKTLPRPTGQATRVIVTQWDMPRRGTVPHDMDVDSQGIFWYADESRMFIGKLDPKTNEFTEYPMPPVPEGDTPGVRDILIDREDNPWFVMRTPGSGTIMAKFDRATEELSTIEGTGGQFLSLGPDGKIWIGRGHCETSSTGCPTRVNPTTMQIDGTFGWDDSPNLPPGPHGAYGGLTMITSGGDPYMTDWVGSYIIGIDVETGEAQFYPTPTRNSLPRRARMDAQDRFWFAEYTGDRIGMLDTRTKEFREWPLPYKYTTPYTVTSPDKNGYVYASSNMSERLTRLDPRTGEVIEYQMPTDFDSKKIGHDPSTDRVTLWMANTRNARVTRVEPLD